MRDDALEHDVGSKDRRAAAQPGERLDERGDECAVAHDVARVVVAVGDREQKLDDVGRREVVDGANARRDGEQRALHKVAWQIGKVVGPRPQRLVVEQRLVAVEQRHQRPPVGRIGLCALRAGRRRQPRGRGDAHADVGLVVANRLLQRGDRRRARARQQKLDGVKLCVDVARLRQLRKRKAKKTETER